MITTARVPISKDIFNNIIMYNGLNNYILYLMCIFIEMLYILRTYVFGDKK
jgi:hypothetical protein